MKALRKIAVLGVTAGLMATGVLMTTPASADPVSSGFAAVGSDTLDASMNALANGTTASGASVRVAAAGSYFGSFDAFPTGSKIQTKPFGAYFVRPSGSSQGRDALRASITGNLWNGVGISGQVDIARSSSGPGGNANANGLLAYVPYARDAVSYAYKAEDAAAAAVLAELSQAQLNSIYSAAAPTVINGITINPRLPQSGSGTRSFFLGAIGVTTPGAAVPAADNTANGPAENDATVLGTNEIIPFSVANWVAQSNNVAPNTIGSTGVLLGSSIPGTAPFTGSGFEPRAQRAVLRQHHVRPRHLPDRRVRPDRLCLGNLRRQPGQPRDPAHELRHAPVDPGCREDQVRLPGAVQHDGHPRLRDPLTLSIHSKIHNKIERN